MENTTNFNSVEQLVDIDTKDNKITKRSKLMKHFLCYEVENGEDFIVYAENEEEAIEIAREYFDVAIVICGEISEEEAENSGLDEY